jgi:hypothetical protein
MNYENKIFRIVLPCELLYDIKPKKYKCCYCYKKYNLKIDYKLHLKIHKNEKFYVCNYQHCYRKFNQLSNLELHKKLYHFENNKKINHTINNILNSFNQVIVGEILYKNNNHYNNKNVNI